MAGGLVGQVPAQEPLWQVSTCSEGCWPLGPRRWQEGRCVRGTVDALTAEACFPDERSSTGPVPVCVSHDLERVDA